VSRRLLGAALPAAVLALLFCACGREGPGGGGGSAAAADSVAADSTRAEAIPVEVAVLQPGPLEAVLRASATLEAESRIEVVSEAARRVVALLAEEGHHVDKGEVLLRLQDDEQRSALARARTQLEHSRREWERQQELHGQGLSTDKSLSDARYQLDQDQIGLEEAQRQLSYTEVRAPIGGTVTRRMVALGDNVQVGQPLFEIIDFASMVARVYVPEKTLKDLAVGQPCRVRAKAVRAEPYVGEVERIAPVVDARTGTVKVTVAVGDQPGLRPGLYVDVGIVTAVDPRALRLPKRALVYDDDQIYAYRLAGGRKVERLPVLPGLSSLDHVQPLTGFAVGDTVVVAGQAALKDGSRVRLVGGNEVQ